MTVYEPAMEGLRTCRVCKVEKSMPAFAISPRNSSGRATICKDCKNAQERQSRIDHPERHRAYHRKAKLKRIYGLTVEQYDAMVQAQEGRCAICRRKSKDRLHVDHDHACCPSKNSCGDCIRGLLCSTCNRVLLGWICDETRKGKDHALDVLNRAFNYVQFGDVSAGQIQNPENAAKVFARNGEAPGALIEVEAL